MKRNETLRETARSMGFDRVVALMDKIAEDGAPTAHLVEPSWPTFVYVDSEGHERSWDPATGAPVPPSFPYVVNLSTAAVE